MRDFCALRLSLRALTLFRSLLEDKVIQAFTHLIDTLCEQLPLEERIDACSAFASSLFSHTTDWTSYVLNAVLEDENPYMLRRARQENLPASLSASLESELASLQQMSQVAGEEVSAAIGYSGFLPVWETSSLDFASIYEDRLKHIPSHGYGIFAKYHIFLMRGDSLVPVRHPDETSLQNLNGYDEERRQVVDNTLALLEGKPAANVLLYGDAGTGKSATVKAIANQYRSQGLRLIELQKNQLRQIPRLLDLLSKNPLKFILFIDDLSFTQNDDDFAALKAILEGSVSARALNLVVYATSNRRHLIKENFRDRDGDDIHLGDTLQELTSLSERFGLTITFSRPNRELYLRIVEGLAQQYGLLPSQEGQLTALAKKAEAYALGRGGRSPRVAKQFIEYLAAAED